jgi:hypothetical protein
VASAGALAWRGDPVPRVSSRGSPGIGVAPRSCGTLDPPPRPLCMGLALVGDGNYSCDLVCCRRRGGNSSHKQAVRGGDSSCKAKAPQARRRLLVQGKGSLCEAETPHAMRRLLVRGRNLSCKAEAPRARWKLVGEASSWSETRHLASDGLDKDQLLFLSWI